jgi:RNA polymerase sigma-70 factor, ECF subfamily
VTGGGGATPAGRDLRDTTDEQVLAVYADADQPRGTREAAFHELVHRFQRRVFAVCHRTLRDPADAEDATQEVFVRLARHADTFRGDAKLSTWLYTVARNVATDRVRHEARRPSTPVEDVAEVVGTRATADDEVGARATAIDLARALARLDAVSRQLLILVAVEGLSYAEAAAASDLAVGTVKSRVSRARVQLGELLATPAPGTTSLPHDGPARPTRTEPDGAHRPRGPPSRP